MVIYLFIYYYYFVQIDQMSSTIVGFSFPSLEVPQLFSNLINVVNNDEF